MKKSIRRISLLLALLMVFATLSMALIGCEDKNLEEPTQGDTGNTDDPGKNPGENPDGVSYSVLVKTAGGMKMERISVNVHAKDNGQSVLSSPLSTNASGAVTFSLTEGNYYVTLSNVPAGYAYEEKYSFTGRECVITLTSSVIKPTVEGVYEAPTVGEYKLGSVMKDFEYTDIDGNTYVLSEMLEEKNAVVLNFWYVDCTFCQQEFPLLDAAYLQYIDGVQVLALNNYEKYFGATSDNVDGIRQFGISQGLNLPLVHDTSDMIFAFDYSAYGLTGTGTENLVYPISVVIDRYGVVCMIELGAILSGNGFKQIFEHFAAEDYEQILVENLDDIAPLEKPNVEMPSQDEIAAVLNGQDDLNVTYYAEKRAELAEYAWPFVITERDGVACLAPSNAGKPSSFAFLNMDIILKKGDVVTFDYFASTEAGADILTTGVKTSADRYLEDLFQISGTEENIWMPCYTYVAPADGTYTISLRYVKDSTEDVGEDTVYIKNLRILKASDIDRETYIPRNAATDPTPTGDGFNTYVPIVYNETDSYYHVGTKDGPILLANLLGVTAFNNGEGSINDYYGNGQLYGNYFESTTDYSASATFYAEAASGGYKFYRLKGAEKEYINIYYYTAISRPAMEYVGAEDATVFTYHAATGAWLTPTLGSGESYFLGAAGHAAIVDPVEFSKISIEGNPPHPVQLIDANKNVVTEPQADTAYGLMFVTGEPVNHYLKSDIKDIPTQLVEHLIDASNSMLNGYCSVNEELKQLLMKISACIAFPDSVHPGNEWLQLCRYYDAYGTDGKQLEDPIKGLSYHSAYTAVENLASTPEIEKNEIYYNGRLLMPRGLLYEFIPEVSGVYCIESYGDQTVEAWIYMQHKTSEVYTYEDLLRHRESSDNCKIYFYMDAGTPYYIDIAFTDLYAAGTIPFSVTYVGTEYTALRYCSEGYFTTADPDNMDQNDLITGGLTTICYDAETDRFYEYYGNDINNRSPLPIYADFTMVSPLFSSYLWDLVRLNGCNFALTQDDEIILEYYEHYPDTYEEKLKELWGEDYDQTYVDETVSGKYHGTMIDYSKTELDVKILKIHEAYAGTAEYDAKMKAELGEDYDPAYIAETVAGNYHGSLVDYAQGQTTAGVDYTEVMSKYLPVLKEGTTNEYIYPEGWIVGGELDGCMELNMELATILQHLVDKYSFMDVTNGWSKLCVYYEFINTNTAIRG